MSAEAIRGIAKNNEAFAKSHKPSLSFETMWPAHNAALVVSCADPRANPNEYWGFGEDGIPVVRNAGGRVTEDVLRTIRGLSAMAGNGTTTMGAVAVVHHTDCGMRHFSNEKLAPLLKLRAGLEGKRAEEVDGMDFLSLTGFASPEESVKHDMAVVKNDPYLPKELEVIGFVYDVFTGKTKEVAVM